jgi:hypothetical protein
MFTKAEQLEKHTKKKEKKEKEKEKEKEQQNCRRYSSRILCIFFLSSTLYALTSCSSSELAGNFVPTKYQEKENT